MTASLCLPITDKATRVVELLDIPRPEPGAVCPLFIATETMAILGYFKSWDEWVIVVFTGVMEVSSGMPNEEAFDGHPLYKCGADRFRCYEVIKSPWISKLEEANRVHRYHSAEEYSQYRHILIGLHDSTFECVARVYKVHVHKGFKDQSTGLSHMMRHFEYSG